MGNNPSKQKHPTKHVLGGGQPKQQAQKQATLQGGKNVLGGGSSPAAPAAQQARGAQGAGDARSAALEAAERRLKAEQARGTNASNPNAGKLAAQAARANSKPATTPSNQKDSNLVWD